MLIRSTALLILMLGAIPALANPSLPPTAAPISEDPIATPAMQLRMGMDSLLAFLNQAPLPARAAIARFLDSEIAPYFDFDHMAQSASGRLYAQMSPQQRSAMAEQIKRLFLTRLTEKLVSYGGQQVRYLPLRTNPDGLQAVASMLILDDTYHYPARIDFRLLRQDEGWSIIDVAANGQSAVVYYRGMLLRSNSYSYYPPQPYRQWQSQPTYPQVYTSPARAYAPYR